MKEAFRERACPLHGYTLDRQLELMTRIYNIAERKQFTGAEIQGAAESVLLSVTITLAARGDADPPLEVRPLNKDGTDTVPAQLDPDFLFAVSPRAHKESTHGPQVEGCRQLRRRGDRATVDKVRRLRETHEAFKAGQTTKRPGQGKKPSRWGSRSFLSK
jgi:hypothetical protein